MNRNQAWQGKLGGFALSGLGGPTAVSDLVAAVAALDLVLPAMDPEVAKNPGVTDSMLDGFDAVEAPEHLVAQILPGHNGPVTLRVLQTIGRRMVQAFEQNDPELIDDEEIAILDDVNKTVLGEDTPDLPADPLRPWTTE